MWIATLGKTKQKKTKKDVLFSEQRNMSEKVSTEWNVKENVLDGCCFFSIKMIYTFLQPIFQNKIIKQFKQDNIYKTNIIFTLTTF